MLQIRQEAFDDGPLVEHLLDLSFGPDRERKVSYRYRRGVEPVRPLCLVALEAGHLVGAIRYWPILLDARPVLLLGPLAIDPAHRGLGVGRALMRESLGRARVLGHDLVLLVGDAAYYRQFGFTTAPGAVRMPDEDPRRLQWLALDGAPLPAAGLLRPAAQAAAAARPSSQPSSGGRTLQTFL